MKTLLVAILLAVPSLQVVADEKADGARTLAEQYAALLREYNSVSGGMRKATTDLERRQAVERLATFAPRFLDLVEKHPEDPIALEILRQAIQVVGSRDSAALIAWETNRSEFPAGSVDDSASRTVALLRRFHLQSDGLGPVIDRMRHAYLLEFAGFLRDVMRRNPHREMQALACLALARFQNDRLGMAQLAEYRPQLIERYGVVFGADYLPELIRVPRVERERRIEDLFERATEYEDVRTPTGDSVAEQASRELFGLRHLTVGKLAPEIEGRDQDGLRFKLSDYRGKVVLLYFWIEL